MKKGWSKLVEYQLAYLDENGDVADDKWFDDKSEAVAVYEFARLTFDSVRLEEVTRIYDGAELYRTNREEL